MKKITILGVVALLAMSTEGYAQYQFDALRFSQSNYGSSARFKGAGEAQIGMGGDLSTLGANPAGLGMFTKSEFSFTPELNLNRSSSSFLGQNGNDQKDRMNFGQIGIAFYSPVAKSRGQDLTKGWLSVNYGLGYARTANYDNNFSYGGLNKANSITDFFAQTASGYGAIPNNLPSGIGTDAYDQFLIENKLDGAGKPTGSYYPLTPTPILAQQSKTESRKGGQSEFNFSIAANYENKFYVGASLGLVNLRYERNSTFNESGDIQSINGLKQTVLTGFNATYMESQTTKGSGVNGRIGVIFKPADEFRIGATIQTPTWLNINDTYSEQLKTSFGRGRIDSQFVSNPQIYDYSYTLRTPFKYSVGTGIIISKIGFISADIDYIDYSSTHFSGSGGDKRNIDAETNGAIAANYKGAINYRVGGEVRLDPILLRAGYGVQGNPYKNGPSGDVKTISGGIGYRSGNYYVDASYQNVQYNSTNTPYGLTDGTSPVADLKNTRHNIFLTVGLRF